jgi:plastocyanin
MCHRTRLALVATLVAVTLSPSPVLAAPSAVTVRAMSYDPSSVDLPAQGAAVRWTNVTSPNRLHDVVSSLPGSFESGLFGNGETYSRRFDAAGTFTYICSLHDVMLGSVSVPLVGEVEQVDGQVRFRLRQGTGPLGRGSRFRYVLSMQGPGDVAPRLVRVSRGAVALVAPAEPGDYRFWSRLKDTVTRRPSADSPAIVLSAPG